MSAPQTPPLSVETLLQQSPHPVTVFTLSWCSYCHAVIRLLNGLKLPFQIIELDSGAYLDAEQHQRIRTELRRMTRSQTLPQVFVGTDSVGGFTETQAALRSGQLQRLLAEHGIELNGN